MNLQTNSQRNGVLTKIRKGMAVYDRQNDHLGNVDEVHFGAATPAEREHGTGPATTAPIQTPGENSLVGMIARTFNPSEVPQELAERLLRTGYLRLDSDGLFGQIVM